MSRHLRIESRSWPLIEHRPPGLRNLSARRRNTHPELPRPFRVPLGGVRIGGVWIGIVPALGILFALMMVIPLIADISQKAMRGNSIPALLLLGYAVVGAAIYIFYGMRHSKLNKGEQA